MTTEEILAKWKNDLPISAVKLTVGTTDIPALHQTYYKVFLEEKKALRKLESELAKLRKEKYTLYHEGPNKENKEKYAWAKKVPAKGLATKREIDIYLDSDEDMMNKSEAVEEQKDKIELLKEILEMIKNRSFHLKLILDTRKFEAGG